MKTDGHQLVLRLTEASPAAATFVLRDAAGRTVSGPQTAPMEDIAGVAPGHGVNVLVPAPDVLLTTVQLPPSRSRDRLMRALPYAVEEQLAEDVDRIHIAAGDVREDGVAVAVVANERMEHWCAACAQAGLNVRSMTSEALALPWKPGRRTLLVERGRSTLRTGRSEGLSVEHAAVPLLLERTADGGPLDVYDYTGAAPDRWFARQDVTRHAVTGDPIALLGAGGGEGHVELQQGRYAPAHRRAAETRYWRRAALLAGASLLSYLLYATADWWRLSQRSERLLTQAAEIYRLATGAEGEVPDAERQFRSFVAQQQGTAGAASGAFLGMLAAIGPVLAGSEGVQMQSLTFREGNLELAVTAPTVAAVDRLRAALTARSGFTVDLLSATSDAGSVSSRMRVSQ